MPAALGFLIALAVGLTGTGAGSIAAPALILFFGLSPAEAVGTALLFGAAIKLAAVPAYLARRQVSFPTLAWFLAGGLPGAVFGTWLLRTLDVRRIHGPLYATLGVTIVAAAGLNIYRAWNRQDEPAPPFNRPHWLPWIALPIGAEVGFSSAGAGALGSLALMGLTRLRPTEVVGTDLCFGLALSLVSGGLQLTAGNFDPRLLTLLIGGGIGGVMAGVLLVGRLPGRALRVTVSLLLVALGLQLCWRAW